MLKILNFLADHPSFVSQFAAYVVAAFVFIMHHRYCDAQHTEMQASIKDLQDNAPPSTEEILQMYETADRTLQAVNKLLRGRGRTIQAQADALASQQGVDTTAPVVRTKRLIGGNAKGVGGLMAAAPIEQSPVAQ